LTGSATRHPKWSTRHRAVRLMRHQAQNCSDRDTFLLALGQLWSAGIDVDWAPRSADHRPQLASLPGYPFVRQRHWVDYKPPVGRAEGTTATNDTAPSAGAATPTHAATNGKSQMEETLQRIWAQCLGVGSINRTANFFELGGDSLIAISVAMTAANEGLDFTPQDLYENQTVAALAKTLIARYAAGGLARQSSNDVVHPPLPPNIEHFLEHGLAEAGRWRIPLILRLRPDLQVEDIRAVLTAVTNQHDALRLRIAERAGTWEQHIGDPHEFTELGTHSLPDGVLPGSSQEREAVFEILKGHIRAQDLSSPPLTATYIRGAADGPCYLAISVHGIVGDNESRDILLTDIFTALGQRLAGEEIALQPVTTPWREWSQRCAGLAAHPAVVESREFWLETAAKATLRMAGQVSQPPAVDDLVRLSSTLTVPETTEIDDARRRLRAPIEEILLAALGRTIAATVGDGSLAVDLGGPGRSVLKPDVDLRRTVGWFTTVYPVALTCAKSQDASARQLMDDVHDTLKAIPHYGIGYGLLRYMYAPTARLLAATPPADIFFSYAGTIPDLPSVPAGDAPIQFDADTAMPVRETIPGLGHAVELRVYRAAGVLHLDWWYDSRRIDPARAGSLADAFSTTVMELTREAVAESEIDLASDELSLVDLSSTEA
jgi:phthiocerol/phenolphthiocerol synthesis type-I polyketide synthase E